MLSMREQGELSDGTIWGPLLVRPSFTLFSLHPQSSGGHQQIISPVHLTTFSLSRPSAYSNTSMTSATIADLPNELLLQIASHLSFSALVRLKNVSRKWRDIVNSTRLDPTSKKLFDAYSCIAKDPLLERSPPSVPTLALADRTRYIQAFNISVNKLHGKTILEGCIAGSLFLMWVMEWPSHAAVGDLSPASVIAAFFNKASYRHVNGKFTRYIGKHTLLSICTEPQQTILMRMPLVSTPNRGMSCAPSATRFGTWARFVPIYTQPRSVGPSIPLIIFSAGGVIASLNHVGAVAGIDSEGRFRLTGFDWAEYLVSMSEQATMKLSGQCLVHLRASGTFFDDYVPLPSPKEREHTRELLQSDPATTSMTGNVVPVALPRNHTLQLQQQSCAPRGSSNSAPEGANSLPMVRDVALEQDQEPSGTASSVTSGAKPHIGTQLHAEQMERGVADPLTGLTALARKSGASSEGNVVREFIYLVFAYFLLHLCLNVVLDGSVSVVSFSSLPSAVARSITSLRHLLTRLSQDQPQQASTIFLL